MIDAKFVREKARANVAKLLAIIQLLTSMCTVRYSLTDFMVQLTSPEEFTLLCCMIREVAPWTRPPTCEIDIPPFLSLSGQVQVFAEHVEEVCSRGARLAPEQIIALERNKREVKMALLANFEAARVPGFPDFKFKTEEQFAETMDRYHRGRAFATAMNMAEIVAANSAEVMQAAQVTQPSTHQGATGGQAATNLALNSDVLGGLADVLEG